MYHDINFLVEESKMEEVQVTKFYMINKSLDLRNLISLLLEEVHSNKIASVNLLFRKENKY